MGHMVSFPVEGAQGHGYLAAPTDGGPGVLVIPPLWGPSPDIAEVCERLAAAGFTALAPDPYRGEIPAEPCEADRSRMSPGLDRAEREISAAVDFLVSLDSVISDGAGVIGFCSGAGLAYLVAARRPDILRAVVPFYGILPGDGVRSELARITAAVQGHYAEFDDSAPPRVVRALESELRDLGVEAEMFVYRGTRSAFCDDTRPEVYDEAAAPAAWDRTLAFLWAKI